MNKVEIKKITFLNGLCINNINRVVALEKKGRFGHSDILDFDIFELLDLLEDIKKEIYLRYDTEDIIQKIDAIYLHNDTILRKNHKDDGYLIEHWG